jgi:P27 family predicted phage terminase small subunit
MRQRKAKSKGGKKSDQNKLPAKPARILECPAELAPVARQEWNRIAGELTRLGVLSSFDRAALAAYCTAYALWLEAAEMVQKHGAMIKSPRGFPIQSPYLSTLNRQAEIMIRLASEFGFTPASRSRSFSFSKSNSMLLEGSADDFQWPDLPEVKVSKPYYIDIEIEDEPDATEMVKSRDDDHLPE